MEHKMNDSPQRSSTVKQSVQEQFSQVATNYSSSSVHESGSELERMARIALTMEATRVLDAGCGPGHLALALAPFVEHVVAVDLSESMLAEGRKLAAHRHITNVDFRLGDVEALPFESRSFDLITSRYSAHHWPNPVTALREFWRLLRTRSIGAGQLLLADVVSSDDSSLDTHIQTIELLRDPSHVRDHSPRQWLLMLESAGFQAELDYSWDLRLDFQSWVDRMATPPASVSMIRAILRQAAGEIKDGLQLEEDYSFTFNCALFRAAKKEP